MKEINEDIRCLNGGLDWKDVKPELEHLLDDRFTIISKE